jgi:phospholipase C
MHPSVQNIQHIVVLMLENRSFDHMLGDLPGADGANRKNKNVAASETYVQTAKAIFQSPMKFDPMHEFANVQQQLGYEKVDMSGFATDALETARKLDGYDKLSQAEQKEIVQTVMDYFPLGTLPTLHTLARNFSVSDRWFASVPASTWSNRFFAMMGSCHGKMRMPENALDADTMIESIAAQLGKDSIFSVLGEDKHKLYSDFTIPLSTLIKGSNPNCPLSEFMSDARNNTLPAFSWIEPDYSSDLRKANSQHPPEDVRRGDALIASVYNALRADEDVWNKSLFVVVYDEHGGYYDHVSPPSTFAPDDELADNNYFDFQQLGVRVPAIFISPWVKPCIVTEKQSKPVYDHTSLLAFVCDRFAPGHKSLLGRRTTLADHIGTADIWLDTPRTDTPISLSSRAPGITKGEYASNEINATMSNLVVQLDVFAAKDNSTDVA